MGEGKAIVVINGSYCYLIESGHNNDGYKVVEMGMTIHQKKIQESIKYLKENEIVDNNGNPTWLSIDTGITEIKILWLDTSE